MSQITIIVIILIVIILIFVFKSESLPEVVLTNWYHYFPELQFSSMEFYKSVESVVTDREVPHAEIIPVEFAEEGGLLSPYRKYLRVRSGAYSFDICAAPYGAGFFVSWWLGEDLGCWTRIMLLIPFYGAYLKKKLLTRTYYIMDTESMFREAIHEAVLTAIDTMTSTKGLRMLSESERQHTTRRR